MEFIRAARGVYDSYSEQFTYRYFGLDGRLISSSLPAPCHTSTPPVVAAAFMVGLIDEAAELLDGQGTSDDQIPVEEEDTEVGYHAAPHQMAAIRLRDAATVAELQAVVASHRTRRENAKLRLQQAQQTHQDPIHPTSS